MELHHIIRIQPASKVWFYYPMEHATLSITSTFPACCQCCIILWDCTSVVSIRPWDVVSVKFPVGLVWLHMQCRDLSRGVVLQTLSRMVWNTFWASSCRRCMYSGLRFPFGRPMLAPPFRLAIDCPPIAHILYTVVQAMPSPPDRDRTVPRATIRLLATVPSNHAVHKTFPTRSAAPRGKYDRPALSCAMRASADIATEPSPGFGWASPNVQRPTCGSVTGGVRGAPADPCGQFPSGPGRSASTFRARAQAPTPLPHAIHAPFALRPMPVRSASPTGEPSAETTE